jgi:hypothetical protein
MFDYGLTTVNDAGLDPDIINLMDICKSKINEVERICYDHSQSKEY